MSPLLSIAWWYLSSVSPKKHCCWVSAAYKMCRVYPLDPHPDAVALYSGCTSGKRRDWFCQMTGTLPPLLHSVVVGGTPERSCVRVLMDSMLLCPDSPLTVTPHKPLNSSRGVISESDLLCASETEILEGLSDQGVTQRQRFGQSQTSCRGQLTSSRCASAEHSSTDCTLEAKCINCSQSHASDSKLCPERKVRKQIEKIKTNKNISYSEARKQIVPQLSQTYAQVTKPTAIFIPTQTDPNITKIICPPLQCLFPISATSSSMPAVSTSSLSTQAYLLPSTSAIIPTIQIPLPESGPATSNSEHSNAPEISKCVKRKSRNRKRPKVQKLEIEIEMTAHRPRKSTPTVSATDEDMITYMITYDVEEEELEPKPKDEFVMGKYWRNNPGKYLRAITPT
ncbi:uncharacterized protein TNCV_4690591 [Trichonephila clavipes]|nr:uncharacterized protein TNCV_4690591 [Trichonephila clavipes]